MPGREDWLTLAREGEPADIRERILTGYKSEWQHLRVLTFDLIVCSLVLQHIEPQPARLFLRDFTDMTPAVYLLTRAMADFDENMLDVIADTELFDAGECVEVDHDPFTHQLKALQTVPFEEARLRRDGHFELLLRPRRQRDASAAHG
jgi:hypothetical protein